MTALVVLGAWLLGYFLTVALLGVIYKDDPKALADLVIFAVPFWPLLLLLLLGSFVAVSVGSKKNVPPDSESPR